MCPTFFEAFKSSIKKKSKLDFYVVAENEEGSVLI